jgi:mono/diheme cytochrome c family protein
VAATLTLALIGYGKVNAVQPNPVSSLTAEITPEKVANGERFARSCAGCHSSNGQLPLNGQDFFGTEGPPIGTLYAPNLTPAHLAEWTDGEIIRAIREGVGRDGRSLMIMPSAAFRNLSDDDVTSLVAYLRSQPAVEPDTPPKQISLVGAIMIAALFPPEIFTAQPPIAGPQGAPARGVTPEYGAYLMSLGCQDCHGGNYAGVPASAASEGGPPPGPNITSVDKRLTADEFVTLLRTGTYPDGTMLSEEMPWPEFEKLSDDDFRAMYAHLESLEDLPDNP